MKKSLLMLALIFPLWGGQTFLAGGFAQSVTIDPKANTTPIFEIKSTTEGMVMPKLTVSQRNVMAGLTAGTQVYCTDCTPYGPYNYDGGSWVAMFQTQTVSPITYTVGQAAQGGIVFWIDPASGGQHGLVAATSDVLYAQSGSTSQWIYTGNDSYLVGAVSVGLYGGEKNTDFVLANNKNEYCAAFYARNYYQNNTSQYGDWYLPSAMELYIMYEKKVLIGGFTSGLYWSSTELTTTQVIARDFSGNPSLGYINKTDYARIRPIRRF